MVPNLTFHLQDFIEGIFTYISIIAVIINLIAWTTNCSDYRLWFATWITELACSGFIEPSAIAPVLKTDSDLLKGIGMVGLNNSI